MFWAPNQKRSCENTTAPPRPSRGPPSAFFHPPPAVRRTGITEYWRCGLPLVDFDISRPDHLAPLLGFGGDESSEIGGRARKRRHTQIGEPRFYLGFGKSNVYLLVQLVDDFGGGVFFGAATP